MAGKYSFKKEPGKQYDEAKRSRAKQRGGIIYLVAVYILYLVYQIVEAKMTGENAMSWTGVVIWGIILGGGAIAVAAYATLRMGRELKESELPPEPESEGTST